ncbi:hypothetical protein [Hymenobacter fodinae]|uniref:Uncharacterized protein n=1 Tax=Hymenobacter fodinae TaxID=2510796 RepID=A0A4Z0P412_9BACT|nr:hypothetical protein [Hymenobacter fodinae]TGE06405.1 hypothetical protein EU556_16310 [Hymenobacter fodinae]
MANPMTLHTHEQDFRNLITITATARGLHQSFIKKDYWVTWVLRNMADSAVADHVVFNYSR